jgi:DNA helicase-2/ATP-dependent DNA helicase PcrA
MTRPGNRETWRIERSYKELDRTALVAEEISRAVGGVDIARWAAFTRGDMFSFQPAAHLQPTMIVPVWRDSQLVDEEIVSVEEVDYEGTIYDLDVEHLHNYIAQGVVVHNSVYGWRGADVRNIRQFEQDYPDAQVILLEQNYRSTQSILDTAQAVINAGAKRKHVKQLWTENGEGVQVSLHEGYDQDAEAAFVADEVARLVASGDVTLRDCAAMYRTNAQSRALEEALSRRGIRYQLIGGLRFWERKEIKDTLAYLRVAYNPYDSVNLTRILNWPARGIGERTEAELTRWAAELGVPVFQALSEVEAPVARTPFNARTLTALRSFLALIAELGDARRELPLVELIARVLDRVGLREALVREYGAEETDDRWANIEELAAFAARYSELPIELQLPTFLEEVALVADLDRLDSDADVVTLITLHQAKGLEYPAVFLVGLEEGLLPHGRSTDDRDKLEEERRLFYVGITRAKRRLYLCYAFRRTSFGRTNTTMASRFLADIPRELLNQPAGRGGTITSPQAGMYGGRGVGSSYGAARTPPRSASPQPRADAASWGSSGGSRQAGPSEVTYFSGQRVRHDRFGEGIVVSSRLVDSDEEVTISFADRERRILAGLARLERIEEG